MADKPETVNVQAAQYHTYDGKEYQIGDTYAAPADLVDSLAAQGKAFRTEAPKAAKAETAKAKGGRRGSRKTAVEPMGTATTNVKPRRLRTKK